MMGLKTLGEIRAELEAALGRGATLRSAQGEVAEALRRFLSPESPSATSAGPDAGRGAARTAKSPAVAPSRRDGGRGGSKTGGRRRA